MRQRERPQTSSPTWSIWKSGNSEVQNLLIAKLIKIIKLCDRNESERWIGGEHGTGQASISFLSNVFQFRFREWKQESVTVWRIRNETKNHMVRLLPASGNVYSQLHLRNLRHERDQLEGNLFACLFGRNCSWSHKKKVSLLGSDRWLRLRFRSITELFTPAI